MIMEQGNKWRQYFIAGIANMGILAVGYCMGWTSPIELKLKDPFETPLGRVVTGDEMSWIGSLLTIGAIFGTLLGGTASSKFGRKNGILAASIPLFVGWILIAAASNFSMICAGRVFWGMTAGMLFTIVPMYVGEIASDDVRGALGSFLQLFIVVGYLLVYVVGPFFSYNVVAYVGIALTILFDVLFVFMPETPSYYLTKNDRESAGKSLAYIRGLSQSGVEIELTNLTSYIQASTTETSKFSDLWATKGNIKALYISCSLLAFQQLSGINAVLFYMERIFKASGSDFDPAIATIIIGAVLVGASSVTPFVVERLGRRALLLISSVGGTIGLGLLGMFFMLSENGSPIVESIGFLPVLSLVLFICVYSIGFGPLPWAVLGELFPMKIKGIATPLATAFCWILAFVVTKYFNKVVDVVGMHFAFWLFAICCVVSFFFNLLVLPETKGKSSEEIEDMLNGRKSSGTNKA